MAKDRDDNGGGGFSGKRDKTWREIDAGRAKGSKYHSRQDDPAQQKIERSASYQKYKTAADALFTGGELPEGLAKTFDPEGKRKAQKQAMQKVTESETRADWVKAVVDYLEKYPELPEDAYFLDSLLDHPRERIVDKALARLEGLAEEGKLPKKVPQSLDQRLKSVELTSMDPDMQGRAKTLREKLRA
ncbi:hypothetical protein HUA74_30875 [Myxococcus sp. CA051A]|uniref:Uncharacterized protein n=1 Tax=Myxococcus llanfairpwllgwyngyllgogerychwyrndrobwllllantysiliogogogochensis TaxID=2590453 RepID=A0A540X5I9_9BACT|nr:MULTISPECIES: hypothetical protein [Myxococcus]NTX06484.1 hypothetical protein [Myxococcus sp. CA040A]NTX09741.1 hypothetical protein [Myxococcus sp. CA056]NTX35101.1 hypothetical protein [Myxococcus sp. CA033]NTX50533.1 hypothetical protein [Myxococcus sp. CA039A]NTX65068.1 hypothetical protein [Myxococcus sp. CA051A]